MAVIIRWLLGGVLLATLAFFAGNALQRLSAEQFYSQARHSHGVESLVLIKQAIDLAPEQYRYHRYRAVTEGGMGRELSRLVALKRAVSLRPTWPYAWTDLALAYAERGQLASEFNTALSRSQVLGRNSSNLAWKRAILAMSVAGQIEDEDTRQRLSEDMLRAYRSNRDKLLGYALLTNNVEAICGQKSLHALDAQLKAWCDKSPWFVMMCLNDKPKTAGVEKSCQSGLKYWQHKAQRRFVLVPDEFFADEAGE